MYDDGQHGDISAGDGIYGAKLSRGIGNFTYTVTMDAVTQRGTNVRRSVQESVDVAPKTVTLPTLDPLEPWIPTPSIDDKRVTVNFSVVPEDKTLDLSSQEALRDLLKHELLINAEIWAVRTDPTTNTKQVEPVAWAVGRRMASNHALPDIPNAINLKADLEYDARWFINAARSGVFRSDHVKLQLRNLEVFDARTMSLRGVEKLVEWIPHDELLQWLQNLPTDVAIDPSLPQNKDMLTGAAPEFVDSVQDSFNSNAFPDAYGNIYLTSGWCGTPRMWEKKRIISSDSEDAAGNKIHERMIHADGLWFAGTKNHRPTQVHVDTFADALVYELEIRPEVAEVWGFSQGGVAAMVARQRWTPLDAVTRTGKPTIQTLAAEFYGTPFATPYRLLPALGRAVARNLWGCKRKVYGKNKFAETIGLGRGTSRRRMRKMPNRILETLRYNATHHRRGFFKKKTYCNRFLSAYIFGPDDGIVAASDARLTRNGRPSLGGETWQSYCHGTGEVELTEEDKKDGASAFFYWEFSMRALEILEDMCEHSIFGGLGKCGEDLDYDKD